MTPPRQRSTVPNTSPIGGERPPLTPNVETLQIGGGGQAGPPAGQAGGSGQASGVPESRSAEVPKWQTLERKEARLRGDQVELLTALRKQVAAQRRDRSAEIITDNTLIRIAVDLLAVHQHRLRGDTEEELLRSVLPRRARQAAASEAADPQATGEPDGRTSGVRE